MPGAEPPELHRLMDELDEAIVSERNKARLNRPPGPAVVVEIENPIAWVHLFRYDPRRYFHDPVFNLCQQLRQKLWRFRNLDDVVPIDNFVPAWLGHYPEYTFFGMHIDVRAHGGPEIQTDHPLTKSPDLAILPSVDFRKSGWMPRMLRWYEDLRELSLNRLNIGFFAWFRGCLDLAVQLRGYENFLLDTFERPEFIHGLLSLLVAERCRWHQAAADYLGEKIGPSFVADDWVAVPYISPAIFHEFVLPRYLEIEAFHGTFAGFHSCGDQAPLHPDMLQIKTLGCFEVSPWMDLSQAMANLPTDKHLNLAAHPNDVVVDTQEQMARKLQAKADLLSGSGRSYTVATSGLTPLQNEAEFVTRVNQWVDAARKAFDL